MGNGRGFQFQQCFHFTSHAHHVKPDGKKTRLLTSVFSAASTTKHNTTTVVDRQTTRNGSNNLRHDAARVRYNNRFVLPPAAPIDRRNKHQSIKNNNHTKTTNSVLLTVGRGHVRGIPCMFWQCSRQRKRENAHTHKQNFADGVCRNATRYNFGTGAASLPPFRQHA